MADYAVPQDCLPPEPLRTFPLSDLAARLRKVVQAHLHAPIDRVLPTYLPSGRVSKLIPTRFAAATCRSHLIATPHSQTKSMRLPLQCIPVPRPPPRPAPIRPLPLPWSPIVQPLPRIA